MVSDQSTNDSRIRREAQGPPSSSTSYADDVRDLQASRASASTARSEWSTTEPCIQPLRMVRRARICGSRAMRTWSGVAGAGPTHSFGGRHTQSTADHPWLARTAAMSRIAKGGAVIGAGDCYEFRSGVCLGFVVGEAIGAGLGAHAVNRGRGAALR